MVNILPIGAKLFATKDKNFILKTKLQIDAIPINAKHPSAMNDAGT